MISIKNCRIILLLSLSTNIFAQITVKVIGIKDDDTVIILEKNNNQKILRLAEVDCPENKQPFGKNGLGWWYQKYSKNENLGDIQSLAKSKKIGLWKDKNSIAPWEWRIKKM